MSDGDDLVEDLKDIRGVGEATAESILEVLDDHGRRADHAGDQDGVDLDRVAELLQEALDHFDAADDTGDVTTQQGMRRVDQAYRRLVDE